MPDVVWMVLGALVWAVGLAGCVLPLLPGLPIVYAALLLQQLRSDRPFTTQFLLVWALLIAITFVIEYWLPVYAAKKYGGSQGGMWGATIGLLVGFFLGPWGLILAPFAGAFLGEWIVQQKTDKAWRAALGSFIGFLSGTVLKLALAGAMGWYLIWSFI